MHKVSLQYVLGDERDLGPVRNPLLDLLHAVESSGSISGAARALGYSYRHVWGELKRWEAQLGREVIVWEKGQSARLTAFGARLLWAERHAQARLAPQIEALRGDLERVFAIAFDGSAQVLTLYASHDDALVLLRDFAPRHGLHLDLRFTGSVDAIRALNQGRCVVAGFHALEQPSSGSEAARAYRPLLKPGLHKIIGFARRTQGLIVPADNPRKLFSLDDVVRSKSRYANRAIGTGTRVLLDELLSRHRLASGDLVGYDSTEPSHAAVAQAVLSGAADCGLGIETAARTRGLGFVPLIEERYHLVCLKEALESPPVRALRSVLADAQWRTALGRLPGYVPDDSAQVLSLTRVLPWWRFGKPGAPAQSSMSKPWASTPKKARAKAASDA